MKLSKVQNRYVNNKKAGFALLKGGSRVGKTTALIFRMINLENNYCIYEDDQILFLSKNTSELNSVKELYREYNNKNQFYSLFTLEKDRIKFNNIEQLIDDYCNFYQIQKGLCLTYIDSKEGMSILENTLFKTQLDEISKKSKSIKNMSLKEIYSEILWIKACGFKREEYISAERKGRKRRINRKSATRDLIYFLVEIYNQILRANSYMDIYDKTLYATNYSKSCNENFSHLMVDDIQYLTKVEIQFVKSLYKKSSYSSISFVLNNKAKCDENAWFIKERKLKTIDDEFNGKSYLFKSEFKTLSVKKEYYIENYQYVDFKHKNILDFNIDTSLNSKEIHLEDGIGFTEEEIQEVPVFNNIAAGNPIEINDSIEDNFYLPKSWLERGKDIFMLNVKGDSMIGKNIYDGDLVVIKKQQIAYHNDIVAANIDGEATLKTLNTNGDIPLLVAANEKYSAISFKDNEVYIIGVALGVIKHKN